MTESDLSNLRARADNGDRDAVDELIEFANERGDADEPLRLAGSGNRTATDELVQLVTERGRHLVVASLCRMRSGRLIYAAVETGS